MNIEVRKIETSKHEIRVAMFWPLPSNPVVEKSRAAKNSKELHSQTPAPCHNRRSPPIFMAQNVRLAPGLCSSWVDRGSTPPRKHKLPYIFRIPAFLLTFSYLFLNILNSCSSSSSPSSNGPFSFHTIVCNTSDWHSSKLQRLSRTFLSVQSLCDSNLIQTFVLSSTATELHKTGWQSGRFAADEQCSPHTGSRFQSVDLVH
jgi:hypothetical protein